MPRGGLFRRSRVRHQQEEQARQRLIRETASNLKRLSELADQLEATAARMLQTVNHQGAKK